MTSSSSSQHDLGLRSTRVRTTVERRHGTLGENVEGPAGESHDGGTTLGFLERIFGKSKQPDSAKRGFEGVRSGSSSTLRKESAPSPAGPAARTTGARTYEVKGGDSLSKISLQFYGDANQWRKIYEANRDQIKDPDLIYPGQTFVIP